SRASLSLVPLPIHFFDALILCPPSSTLFPYTTLFRSKCVRLLYLSRAVILSRLIAPVLVHRQVLSWLIYNMVAVVFRILRFLLLNIFPGFFRRFFFVYSCMVIHYDSFIFSLFIFAYSLFIVRNYNVYMFYIRS